MKLACSVLASSLFVAVSSGAIDLTQVGHEPNELPAVGHGEVAIRFQLPEPAKVSAHIYDGREIRVRTLGGNELLSQGEHALDWDGRDHRGRPVPPEAYHYTLEITTAADEQTTWDLSDVSGGETLTPERVTWDASKGTVQYTLAQPARVRIRIGLQDGGPLLRTLIDWVPRSTGPHSEKWNGKDVSGGVDLTEHPRLELVAEAFALPRNTILVGPPANQVTFLDGLEDAPRRAARAPQSRRMLDFARQPIETRRDFPVTLEIAGKPSRSSDGTHHVTGIVPVRVSVGADDLARVLDERCEVVFFLDGQFLFEMESGVLPTTWRWDTSGTNPGRHYLTANIRGYDGHFGIDTLQVIVAPREDASEAKSQRGS